MEEDEPVMKVRSIWTDYEREEDKETNETTPARTKEEIYLIIWECLILFFVLSWQDLNELCGFKTNFFLFSKLINSITMEELQVK